MKSHTDLFAIEDIPVLDRSTLERWATCPRQAWAREVEPSLPTMEQGVGTEGHAALSDAVAAYLDEMGQMRPAELCQWLKTRLKECRTDLQPQVLDAFAPSFAWEWAHFIVGRSPLDIMRFDGGPGEQSGQVSRDVTIGNDVVRLTSEVDLLLGTASPEVLQEVDYKTGWTPYTWQTVKDSFQFRMHAWILFDLYEPLQRLEVAVWDTRKNQRTNWVRFTRSEMYGVDEQIKMAVGHWWQHRKAEAIGQVPAWPLEGKCQRCPAAVLCSDATFTSEDPADMCDRLVSLEAACDQLREKLGAVVDATGGDVVTKHGNAYGTDKPKANRKPTKASYTKQP